jgi:hypothetical protein
MKRRVMNGRLIIVGSSLALGFVLVTACGGVDTSDDVDRSQRAGSAPANEVADGVNNPQSVVDGWQNRLTRGHQAEGQVDRPSASNHWSYCFTKRQTYRSWVRIQIGMPRCAGSNAGPAHRHALAVMDSHCFMNPNHWLVYSKRSTLVCRPPR